MDIRKKALEASSDDSDDDKQIQDKEESVAATKPKRGANSKKAKVAPAVVVEDVEEAKDPVPEDRTISIGSPIQPVLKVVLPFADAK